MIRFNQVCHYVRNIANGLSLTLQARYMSDTISRHTLRLICNAISTISSTWLYHKAIYLNEYV
ncbi:hypothetical protein CY34DRAFT_412294 [Suillus luteus UH-Slu-Lm8-n1]|uniref:Uncharacterized protein n=1 Tax=Suillus luteus UH-Slu-Lm8-n1 TaxID=930992 RepID=A0A0D0A8K8_9AGAM|nr:hypothetical protein CY34DRAFT_412294 [Suillus luteus UH-Slu-Lm8-n1]